MGTGTNQKYFKPHSAKQDTVIFSEKKLVIAATGIQWGKTESGVIWLRMLTSKFTDSRDNFIVTSPSFPTMAQSTMPAFNHWFKDLGDHDKKENCYHISGGGTIWFRTGTNPDSVVGITRVRGILCDEAGLYSLYFWENIQGRSSFMEAPIRIVTSPYSLNWLHRDYIQPYNRGIESCVKNIDLIQARSDENPYFPKNEYQRKKETMDSRRFNMMYGGNFDRMEGLVYDCFDDDQKIVAPKILPQETRYFGAIDWGFADPSVIKIRAVTPTGVHYSIYEYYKSRKTIADLVDICRRIKGLFPVELFVCDPSRPDNISQLNIAGISAIPAQNDIQLGIDKHYELISSNLYYVFQGSCPHTIDEYASYHYPEPKNLLPDQSAHKAHFLPVDKDNHCMDCERYLTLYLEGIFGHKKGMKTKDSLDKIKPSIHNVDIEYNKYLKKKSHKKYHGI